MRVIKMLAKDWAKYSQDAHLVCFDEMRSPDFNRIDFALTSVLDSVPQSYMTCRELDAETVYLQYGGAFPSAKGTVRSFSGYKQMISELSISYTRATTLIQNQNTAMLKFAMAVGFRIIGVRTFKNEIYVEHLMEFGDFSV
jgi:hypothetical protein